MNSKRWWIVSMAASMAWLPAAAATHPCAATLLPAERLACYDAAFPPTGDVQAAAREQAARAFGQKEPGPALRNPGQPAADVDPDRIEARVARVDHGPGGRLVELANGQSWRVLDGSSQGHLAEGDLITVRKAALGGYQLVTAAGVGLRVRRVH